MIQTIRPIIVYYALALLSVSTAVAAPFNTSAVTSSTLENGLEVIVMEDHSTELVALNVVVKAGPLYETKSNNGVTHFIEHLLFKGTTARAEGQADLEIESVGATLDASTSKESVMVRTVVASKYFDLALNTLVDVAMRAKLDARHLDAQKSIILDEISRRDSHPLQTVATLVAKASFPTHPYGFNIEGTAETVKSITAEQIRAFYDTYFVPNNAAVVIVGDVNPAKVTEAVKRATIDLKKKELAETARPLEAPPTQVVKETAKRATNIIYSALNFPGPSVKDFDEVCATDVLVFYLATGYGSWMESLQPAKGMVQAVSGDFVTRKDPSNIMIMYGVDDASAVEDIRRVIVTKLKELKEKPLPEADINGAKRKLEGSFAFDTETFAGRARVLAFYEALGDYKNALAYIDTVRKVTPEQIQKLAAKYINIDAYVVVEVGP